jgi:hypothetical protein
MLLFHIFNYIIINIQNFILYNMVAAGFSLRFSTTNWCMRISHKLRNLKDAATRPNILFDTNMHKSFN